MYLSEFPKISPGTAQYGFIARGKSTYSRHVFETKSINYHYIRFDTRPRTSDIDLI